MHLLEPRANPSPLMRWPGPPIAILLTLLAAAALFAALGKPPLQAFYVFFIEPPETSNGWGGLALEASPGYGVLWRLQRNLQLTLGAPVDEVHARIARLGRGDFSATIPIGGQVLFYDPGIYAALVARGLVRTTLGLHMAGNNDEDYMVWAECARYTKIYNLQQELFFYRTHATQISTEKRLLQIDKTNNVIRTLLSNLM